MNINEFITFLYNEGLITGNLSEETDEAFMNRLRIQKYVLIARHLGIKEFYAYDYDIYIYGPYSSRLADEYYAYAKNSTTTVSVVNNIDKGFADKFLTIVRDKDNDWLEVAGTILHLKEKYSNKDTILNLAIDIKEHRFGKEKIEQIFKELEGYGLL